MNTFQQLSTLPARCRQAVKSSRWDGYTARRSSSAVSQELWTCVNHRF